MRTLRLLLLALVLLGTVSGSALAAPVDPQAAPGRYEAAAAAAVYRTHLPLLSRPAVSYRLGYDSAIARIDAYPGIESLKAGWYLDWDVGSAPVRPNGMEYVQVVRIHQQISCGLGSPNAHDRTKCPYVQPLNYMLKWGQAGIEAAAHANRGSLWLIGNEMDRRDWPGGNQDEMLPETYAVAYHDLYHLIKGIDPTAQLGIGGVIQATPLRLVYLTRIWDAYEERYGEPMPVDVWNVHNFILRESFDGHGANIPPGIDYQPGTTYDDADHVNMTIFDAQIRAFRQWMKDRGEQEKPLIVSEYGVLYRHTAEVDTQAEVQAFMIASFDYFLNTRDCNLGYAQDDCRLVQRWAWYSLDDTGIGNGFNPYAALYDPGTKQITPTGAAFRDWSISNLPRLAKW